MSEMRLLPLSLIADLFHAEALTVFSVNFTDKGWRVLFTTGKENKFSYSLVGLRAVRGGERFYKSLDSLHDMLQKIGCKSFQVSIHQRLVGLAEPPLPDSKTIPKTEHTGPRVGGQRTNPGIERMYELREKRKRSSHLTRAERGELKHLESQYHWNKP